MQTRAIQEHAQHLMASFQLISYVLMVAAGALLVSKGELTMGGMIACSILSGRVLTPAGMIPNQLVQWANTKAALIGLDRLWALQDDHHGIDQPLVPASVQGRYRFEDVSSAYGGNKALEIKALNIQAGEKIGVIGPIGGARLRSCACSAACTSPKAGDCCSTTWSSRTSPSRCSPSALATCSKTGACLPAACATTWCWACWIPATR
jgi:ATP-binding cassette subfamily C protein LapB